MPTKRKAPAVSEAQIQETCTQFLEWDNWRSLKTDPVSDRGRGKGFGELGMADHLYIRYRDAELDGKFNLQLAITQVMWIEWKRKGGKAAQHQKDWHTLERKLGALTLIAGEDFPASIEGFKEFYRGSGLQRKAIS